LHILWNEGYQIDDDKYKAELQWQCEKILELRPKLTMLNIVRLQYFVTPEMQEWVNMNILPQLFQSGIEKMALVIPEDVFLQISLEMQLDDNPGSTNLVHYFPDEEKALEWVFEN
jgi:hypothetical protein